MIINENNKNSILKGMVKRGFNQDPNELKARMHPNMDKVIPSINPKVTDKNEKTIANDNLRETFNALRRLKWI